MIRRLNNIIKRERFLRPDSFTVVLLLTGIYKGIKKRGVDILMTFKKDSTFTSKEDLEMCSLLPLKVLELITRELNPKSVLDVGCGTGLSLKYFLDKGINAMGLENSIEAINNSPVKKNIIKHNLKNIYNSDKTFDLIWCFEVIEHIHPNFEKNFLQTLINHSDNIILSAARPGQGGRGHFNEQEPQYWIDRFSSLGYENDNTLTTLFRSTGEPFTANILFFKKRILK